MLDLSHRAESLEPSATLAVAARARALRDQGVDVLSFSLGEPDFDTPERIKQAAVDAIKAGQTGYAPVPGDPETRALIAEKLQRENKLAGVTADHVVITAGAKHAIYLTLQALIDPSCAGEPQAEVIIPTPGWVSYAPQTRLAGARVVEAPTTAAENYKLAPALLDRLITPLTRAIILNTPSNPTGVMHTPNELRALGEIVAGAASIAPNLIVIADEIYEKITLANIPHFSIGSIEAIADRVITINGMSKAFAMTGWRLGYLAGSGDFGLRLAKAATRLQGQMNSCVTSFALPAIRVALTQCADDVERMRSAFVARGERLHTKLAVMPGVRCPKPTGAFYAFPDVADHFGKKTPVGIVIEDSISFAAALLEDQHVAVVPGAPFGGAGKRCVRISFACSQAQIDEGMDRLAAFIASLS